MFAHIFVYLFVTTCMHDIYDNMIIFDKQMNGKKQLLKQASKALQVASKIIYMYCLFSRLSNSKIGS